MPDNQPQQERADIVLEKTILGAALLDTDSLEYMIENARAGDFSTQPNATIFSKMAEMLGNGLVVDRNTLMASLRFSPDLLQRAGGETYVRSLEAVPLDRKSTRLNSSHRCIS